MKKYLVLLLLGAGSLAFGQGVFISPQIAFKVVNGFTSPIANATITVCAANASGIPCSPALVGAIFQDAAFTQPLSNPFTADALGNYQFAILPGIYTVCTTASGFAGQCFQIPAGAGAPSSIPTQIVQSGLLAEYRITDGSGTVLTDSSGNGRNGTFCASGPAWSGLFPNTAGLTFNGNNSCINLPVSLNSARTIIAATTFIPPNSSSFQNLVCGNGVSGWNAMYQGNQLGQWAGPQGEYLFSGWTTVSGANVKQIIATQPANGTQIVAWTLGSAGDSTKDQIWTNNSFPPFNALEPPLVNNQAFLTTGQSAGVQSTGNYVVGGGASGSTCLAGFNTWWKGTLYKLIFYSTYLNQQQLGQDFTAIGSTLSQQGVQLSATTLGQAGAVGPNNLNQYVALGDSITYGTGVTTSFPQFITFNPNSAVWNWIDLGLPSALASGDVTDSFTNRLAYAFYTGAANNVATYWMGTNDCAIGGFTGLQAWADVGNAVRNYRSHLASTSQKIIGLSMISRTGNDPCKNTLNTVMRQQWATVFDGFADVAADPNLGADGASANATYFQGDAVHPTTYAQANDIAPIVQRAIRRLFGNTSWTSANTYTTTAAAPTATTAGSESGNTVTITFGATPANCLQGSPITIAGTTPGGYSGVFNILTRTATQVTYFDVSGLGAITVQGTGVCPTQVDEDQYVILAGSAVTPSFTLETCQGFTGQNIYLKNSNTTSPWTITPFTASETIDGAASLAMPAASAGNNPVVVLQSTLVSAAAGGCTWKRVQ